MVVVYKRKINIRDEKLSQWQGCVLLYRHEKWWLALMPFCFPCFCLFSSILGGSSGGVEKSGRAFHSWALIVLLMAFLVARVACIDSRVFFSHTAGSGNGRWRGHRTRLNYLFEYFSDVSEEVWNAFIAWEKQNDKRKKKDRLAAISYTGTDKVTSAATLVQGQPTQTCFIWIVFSTYLGRHWCRW